MGKLLLHMKAYLKESIIGPLFKLFEAGFELLIPLVVAAIIDIGILGKDYNYVVRMVIILLLLALLGMICAISAQYFAAKASVGFAGKIRKELFAHIQSLSFTELDSLGSSTLMTRITSDINQVQTGINLALRLLLRSPFIVFGAMIMAFTIDFNVALVFVAVIPLLLAVIFFVMLKCIPLYKGVQSKLEDVLTLTKENLSGVRVIRAFGHESDEIKTFETKTTQLVLDQLHAGRFSALMNPLTYVTINCAIIALIWTGAIRVETGILSQGAIVALYNYISQILVELIKLANLLINISKAIASGNRISAIFDVKSSLDVKKAWAIESQRNLAAIAFHNVSMCYKGAKAPFLKNIDFTVLHGETIGIIGATGSGKSSLINLIPRFYDVTEGEILIDGINIKDYPLETLRRKIGIVPQKAVLFKGTIRENMLWGREGATDEEIMQAIDLAQADSFVRGKEGGLDYTIEQNGRNLSGGQRQRLTIARALLRKPEILILDDSASALDYATEAALRRAIHSLEGITVFIVSQRASSIQHADRILVLDDGKIVGNGTSEELLKSCQIYREIFETQFKKEVEA